MAEESKGEIFTFTTPMTLVFPSLFTTERFRTPEGVKQDTERYSATFLFDLDHADFQGVKATAATVARSKWPNRDIGADYKAGELRMPWKIGDTEIAKRQAFLERRGESLDSLSKMDWQKGKASLKATSYQFPRMSVLVGGKAVDLDGIDGMLTRKYKDKFYPGVKVLAELYFVAKNAKSADKQDGVIAYLNQIMSLGEGERMGGGRSANDAFKSYIGKVSTLRVVGGTDPDGLGSEVPF
jgi:hypothetical protein